MTQEQAKKWLPVITAFAEGKTIQVKGSDGEWYDDYFDVHFFLNKEYRIKPSGPREFFVVDMYPFKTVYNSLEEAKKHSSLGNFKIIRVVEDLSWKP